MTDFHGASASLEAAARAQQRARADARWFPWMCIGVGLVVIPAGTVVPWDWPYRLVVTALGLALAVGLLWLTGRMRATPRGSKSAMNVAVGCWIGLSVIIAALGRDIESLGLALACSAIASTPFLVVAARFRSGGNVPR